MKAFAVTLLFIAGLSGPAGAATVCLYDGGNVTGTVTGPKEITTADLSCVIRGPGQGVNNKLIVISWKNTADAAKMKMGASVTLSGLYTVKRNGPTRHNATLMIGDAVFVK